MILDIFVILLVALLASVILLKLLLGKNSILHIPKGKDEIAQLLVDNIIVDGMKKKLPPYADVYFFPESELPNLREYGMRDYIEMPLEVRMNNTVTHNVASKDGVLYISIDANEDIISKWIYIYVYRISSFDVYMRRKFLSNWQEIRFINHFPEVKERKIRARLLLNNGFYHRLIMNMEIYHLQRMERIKARRKEKGKELTGISAFIDSWNPTNKGELIGCRGIWATIIVGILSVVISINWDSIVTFFIGLYNKIR